MNAGNTVQGRADRWGISMVFKNALLVALAFGVFVSLAPAAALADEVNPMSTSCKDEIVARNMKSVNQWSANLALTATDRAQFLTNSDTGYSAKVAADHYEYLKETGAPAWTIVRFYVTPAVEKAMREGVETPALQGFSSNFMFVQADGNCYVSEDRFDDLRYYPRTVAYLMARILTSQSMGASNGELPPGLDDLFKAMSKQQLRLPIDAAVQRMITEKGGAPGQDEAAQDVSEQPGPQIANLCRTRMKRVMIMKGDLKDLNVLQSKDVGDVENYDNLPALKKRLTALCFKELDDNFVKVRIPGDVVRCRFIEGRLECYAE